MASLLIIKSANIESESFYDENM